MWLILLKCSIVLIVVVLILLYFIFARSGQVNRDR